MRPRIIRYIFRSIYRIAMVMHSINEQMAQIESARTEMQIRFESSLIGLFRLRFLTDENSESSDTIRPKVGINFAKVSPDKLNSYF